MRFSIRTLLNAITIVAVVLSALLLAYRTITDDQPFVRIEPGMTTSQVLSIVGEPHHVKSNGDWYYALRSPGGPIAIVFDSNEQVVGLDWSPSFD